MKPTSTAEENAPQQPASSTNQKPAKRGSVEEAPARAQAQKRRRRAFSCLSCQKLKCRCEYDPGALGCHRCQTLRIECSLRGEYASSPSNPTSEQPASSVEERLQRHEEALQEIKSMLQDLSSQVQPNNHNRAPIRRGSLHYNNARLEKESSGPEYFSNPADKGTQSAPVVVLRGISEQVRGGYRRLLSIVNLDIVQLQLLDEQTANELLQLFIRYQGHNLLVCSMEELTKSSETREVSAFLYSVCCMIGIVYRNDICGTLMHRQVYEQVRITLGQALLSSPLNLEEINAVLIMSNNANTPSSNGSEYVDSWLLTGYCAKQAMLSISFSNIVNNIKRGSPTIEDHRTIHLWSTICLHHLHWAATTGRPSIIPIAYINQCNILLSFYQATMQDGMLVAEILLYSTLHQKLDHHPYLGDGGECEEFLSWKQKWSHLLALSTSSMLRIGYHAACLILAVRSLEEAGHAIRTKTFLSDGDAATDNTSDDESHNHNKRQEAAETTSDNGSLLRANACKFAMLVLQTFLEMPPFLMDAVPTCLCLCIGYCGLLLAHYDESHSKIPDQVSLSLVTRLDEWIRHSPGKAWSYKYGALAKHKVESRINGRGRAGDGQQPSPRLQPRNRSNVHESANILAPTDGPAGQRHGSESTDYQTDELIPSAVQPLETDAALPSFDVSEHTVFPSMEDFFGGGFLDFMK